MVYGSPIQNLSALSGAEYDLEDSTPSVWTVAEIHIGPLIFVSPTHVRLFISLNARSADIVTILQSGYNSSLRAITKKGDFITSFISTPWAGSSDYKQPQILDADFTTYTGDNRIDSIIVDSWVVMNGEAIPGTSRADTNTVYPDGSKSPAQFYIEWIESAFVVVGKNNNYLRRNKYNTQHACLSPNPVKGQTHRIKNGSYGPYNSSTVFIHAFDKQIDNRGANLFLSQTYSGLAGDIYGNRINVSYPFEENGFILPPLHACMLVYDGTKWLIQEYFNGARDANSYNWAISTPPNPCPVANQPVVLCDINATTSKYVQLPDPAGPLKFLRIIALSTTQNMSNVVRIYPFPTTNVDLPHGLEDNASNAMFIRAYNTAGTACMTLISDGLQWWVFNVYDGIYGIYNTTQSGREVVTSPISIVRSPNVDGVNLPPVTILPGLAMEQFVKMDATSQFNSVVISTTDSTAVRIGTAANNCMYVGPWKNYTAVSVIGMKNGINTVYYVTGFFSGY